MLLTPNVVGVVVEVDALGLFSVTTIVSTGSIIIFASFTSLSQDVLTRRLSLSQYVSQNTNKIDTPPPQHYHGSQRPLQQHLNNTTQTLPRRSPRRNRRNPSPTNPSQQPRSQRTIPTIRRQTGTLRCPRKAIPTQIPIP